MIGGARRRRAARRATGEFTRNRMTELMKIAALFAVTALAEIVGCYLPWLVLKGGRPVWLLTLHPSAAGRTYAAYGGVYIAVALIWLRVVDGVALTRGDAAGAVLALGGMAVIALQPRA
jgi:small multidrug resistance family-3 protein